jgi:S-adenosylmethionine-diacylglycerol 3-amino-3-carboxypropyl transferase
MPSSVISEKAAFNFIRYASVWEDGDILCEALGPSCNNGRILSIASSGDNVLALLTVNPKEIVAADLSSAQLACVELRMAAFRHLAHPDLLAFLGVTPSPDRQQTYLQLKGDLTPSALEFWNTHPNAIKDGIIHAGKFERYLKFFGTKILPWIHTKNKRDSLLTSRTLSEQTQFYNLHWDTWLWKSFFKVFFSKTLMGMLGRDPAFFDHVEGTVSEKLLTRTRHAMTQLPTHNNPYLVYILTGNYDPQALPRYLRPEYKDLITSSLGRIKLFQGAIQEAAEGPFDGYNLSDIFEYMNEKEFEVCYEALVRKANPGARLAYWNMLVPRSTPPLLKSHVHSLADISSALHFHDKAWFYQAFHVDEVVAKP